MRVSTSLMFQQGVQSLQRQQSEMIRAQTDIATGVKLRTADRDPVAFGQASQLTNQQARVDQFLRSNEMATGKIEAQETRLSASTDILQRVRDIAIQANNGANDATSRAALADQLAELRDALAGQANAKDERGEYVFSGTQAGQVPYDAAGVDQLAGAAQPVDLQVSESDSVTVNRVASDIFNTAPGSNRSAMQVIDDLEAAVRTGNDAAYGGLQGEVDDVLDRVITAQGEMGNQLNKLERLQDDQSAWSLSNKESISKLRDTDLAEAITRLNENYLTLQATQQSMAKIQQLSLFNNL
ncbi:flagellar hook-associated protein FlgL [Guyparkeria halophila]|uniref:Flagellar hook-associated protein FlgL n=1 Tax=Guyparkeria halophila TaxID=47960 RepID=A0ABZ0YY37_9GAMM|nr:flagellar hook-associated protein FlgL [Guyparkeria halophila]WQH17101.1 flagellar hook-associated protein FlgL [Guyparkeria halophila]